MKRPQNAALTPSTTAQLQELGMKLAQMRKARRITQSEIAERTNISRDTVSRIESGDASVAIGQVLRYLDAIAPGASLKNVYEHDSAVEIMENKARRVRARKPSAKKLTQYDF